MALNWKNTSETYVPKSFHKVLKRNAPGLLFSAIVFGYYLTIQAGWRWPTLILLALLLWLLVLALYWVPSLFREEVVLYVKPPKYFWLWPLFQAICGAVLVAIVIVFWYLQAPYIGRFFRRNHLYVFALVSVAVVLGFAKLLLADSDLEEFMDGFKTFPLLSPIICFGAPAAWKDNLIKFGLLKTSLRVPAFLLFASGFTFIASLLLFWLGKSRKKANQTKAESTKAPVLFAASGAPLGSRNDSQTSVKGYFLSSSILTLIGLPMLFVAILELAYYIVRA